MLVKLRDGRVDGRQAADLRAAAVLRGVPARPRRSPRRPTSPRASAGSAPSPTRRARCSRWRRLRASRSAASSGRSAGSSTAASGSRATRCTSSCSTHRTSSATTSAIELAKDHRELVERALHMKKTGNEVMRVIGGREVHPINVKVGGFYRAPSKARARARSSRTSSGRASSRSRPSASPPASTSPTSSRTTSSSRSPSPAVYPIDLGRIVSNRGLDIPVSEYERALRRGARRVVDRAALARDRARQLPRRAARPLRAPRRHALAAREGVGRRGRASTRPSATRSARSSSARSSSSTPRTRRCG